MSDVPLTPGTMVKLKSGGPGMTVIDNVMPDGTKNDDGAQCEWFNEAGERQNGWFVRATLTALG